MHGTHSQCVLIVDDDRDLAEGLALALECEGRTVIICADIESAELVLQRFPVTDVVSDVQFSGLFGFEGLHFLGRACRSETSRPRAILMTGHASDSLRAAAEAMGAHAVLTKPFTVEELEQALQPVTPGAGAGEARIVRIDAIDEIIASRSLTMAFQPIVQLADPSDSPIGFEALTRATEGWPLGGPVELFEYASKRSRLPDLNRAAIECAIEAAGELPDGPAIFLNLDPAAFDERLLRTLEQATRRAGVPFNRLVLEVTERSRFEDEAAASELFDRLHAHGARFALDDHGSSYSHLSMISRIRPSFVKISATFGTGLELDSSRERVVRHIVALAKDFGAQSILEGIESEETAARARAIGVDLAQGFHFGRPAAAGCWARTGRAA